MNVTLSGVYKFELVRYIYIYMYGGTYAIIVAHATHTKCGRGSATTIFLYVPAVSNVVTSGNGTGTKNYLKGTVRLGLSLVSCLLSTALLL